MCSMRLIRNTEREIKRSQMGCLGALIHTILLFQGKMLLQLLFMLMMKSGFVSNYLTQQTLLTLDSIFSLPGCCFLSKLSTVKLWAACSGPVHAISSKGVWCSSSLIYSWNFPEKKATVKSEEKNNDPYLLKILQQRLHVLMFFSSCPGFLPQSKDMLIA